MISFAEALDRVAAIARPLGSETVPIEAAAGRVLARPVIASIDSPLSDVSSMDGYAVRDADIVTTPARLRVSGTSYPGAGWTSSIGEGECVRIFTGAPIPDGADSVVIQEEARREGDFVVLESCSGPTRYVRYRGGDFRRGDQVLHAGRQLGARAMVAAAGADAASVNVFVRPRVAILSTGDELVPPGQASERLDVIPDSISLGIAASVEEWGGLVESRRCLPDQLDLLVKVAVDVTRAADVVVVTGGASVGERDYAKAMFEPLGPDLIFSKVSIKPGKPAWLARCGETIVFGLPGNPTSAMVTARLFLAPLLAGLSGRACTDALKWRIARLSNPLPECGTRETFHRARQVGDRVETLSFQESSAQSALADADVLIRQPAHSPAIETDSEVSVLDF